MGRHKYTQVIITASKNLFESPLEFDKIPDQDLFQRAIKESDIYYYTSTQDFIEDLRNYADLNQWLFKTIQVPEVVLFYLNGSSIEESD